MLKLQQNLGACVMDDGCQSNRIVEQAGGQNGIFQLPQAGFVHDAVANDEESGTVAAGAFLIKCDEPRVQEVLLFKAGFDGSHDDPVFQEVRSHLQRQKQMRIGGHELVKLLQMVDAERHQHGRHDVETWLQVVCLIVEEYVRPDGLEKRLLVEAVKQKELCSAHAEAFERGDQTFFARRPPCCDDGNANGRFKIRI